MVMFENFFRKNDGYDVEAIPPKGPGDITSEEAEMLEAKRKRIDELDAKIVEIENDTSHPEYDRLEKLRDELRLLEGPKE